MSTLIEFARGPLFVATFSFMVLGLLRHVILNVTQFRTCVGRLTQRRLELGKNAMEILDWLVPFRHIKRDGLWLSVSSFLFHVGLLLVPLLLLDHIVLWEGGLGLTWPGLNPWVADILTGLVLLTGAMLFGYRVFNRGARVLSSGPDYLILGFLMLPFVSGFMAMHPSVNPLAYNTMMLIHILSAELVFVLIPSTKLAHCVLFPFLRVSSGLFWRMPPGAGERVARELHGEEARI